MKLHDLPTEVLVMIAEALQNARDINTLARTSPALYSCINYVLYKFDVVDQNGKALIWAARRNKPATAKKSIQAGVKKLKQWHRRPLACALQHGHEPMMRLLLDEGVDPDEILFDGSPMETTALYMAACNGNDAIVKLLIEKGASINLRHAPGHPLVIAATYNRKTVVRILLEEGADPNVWRYDQVTALNIAAMRGHSEIVSMLLNKGARTELADHHGTTPLQSAIKRRHGKITQLLLEGGADLESRDASGRTALDLGVTDGSPQLRSLLLKQVANLDAQNFWPLHTAISEKKTALIRLLVDHGADVNRRDSKGRTPLHYAMLRKRDEIVEFLLQCDVDPDAESNNGLTPLKLAIRGNREYWAAILRGKRDDPKSSRP